MDSVDYYPSMLPEIVRSGVLADDPFVLVDVGCGLGIDPVWRLFEPHLRAEALDPQVDEVERLRREETNEHVRYHAALVGLAEDDPFLVERRAEEQRELAYNPWSRLSTAAALSVAAAAGPGDLEENNDWSLRELATRKVGLAAFLAAEGVGSVDFLKTDTDGSDFEVLHSFDAAIEPMRVLGFVVETPYVGSDSETAHTFHNVDRFMKRRGFSLFSLSVNRYSRAALPAPFTHSILAQTAWGQPIWGDLVYLRDGGTANVELSPTKLLKLACLCELFRSPDVAAEILVVHRAELEPLLDVDRLLDLLTPRLRGKRLGYAEYVAAFAADPTSFYPDAAGDPATGKPGALQSPLWRAPRAIARRLRRRAR